MLYLTDPEELASVWPDEPDYRGDQLRSWLYETPVLTAEEMTNIPGALRDGLELWPFQVEAEQIADSGRTVKWLMRAPDGASIEAVLMGYAKRTTLCISSQAGCAMACTFCATGQFGFERHLQAGEIVAQVTYAAAFLRSHGLGGSPPRVTNLVFMGMGEPLANYRHVKTAIDRLTGTMGMSARSITVSTVGVAPAIRRLADEPWRVNLAVSLHAADDELRTTLVPLNKRYPLEEVISATEYFMDETGRRPSIEWTLIAGTNDTMEQADKLARIARRLRAHINVIALNPTPLTADQPPTPAATRSFMGRLMASGANVTFRDTRGQDIDAACGQLPGAPDNGGNVRGRTLLVLGLLLATAACGTGDRQGAVGGAPLLTPAEAQNRDGVVAVQGFLWARPGDNSFRLCEAALESFPPQCGEPAIDLTEVDVTAIAGVDFSQNVFWADGIRARGELAGGVLFVEAIELNTNDSGTGLSFRILVPVELSPGSSDFVALVTNSSAVPVGLRFTNGQSADVTLSDVETGSRLYQWSAGRGFDDAIREITIEPGETLRFPLLESDLELEPGAYDLVGVFAGAPSPGTVRGRAVIR